MSLLFEKFRSLMCYWTLIEVLCIPPVNKLISYDLILLKNKDHTALSIDHMT